VVLLAILNVLDILGGISLIANISFLLYPLGIFHFLKGAWTIYTSIQQGFFFEVLGGIDFIGGLCLILVNWHISSTYFLVIGILMVAKGVFCFMCR